jgi:hypothetical protein
VQATGPDSPSLPEKLIVTPWLYQPFWSGPLLTLPLADGAVASYLKVKDAPLVLPATSEQLPVIVTEPESGPV